MRKKIELIQEDNFESEGSESEVDSEEESDFGSLDDIPLEVVNAGEAPEKRKASNASDSEEDSGEKPKEKKLKSEYFKAPTAEELSTLKETENLFHSNIFRLQIEELLNELKVKDKYKSPIQKWVGSLKSFLQSLPETESCKLDEVKFIDELGVKSPLDESRPDKKTLFRFIPPSNVQIVGSHNLEATSKPIISVDVGVQMPKGCFRDKDAQDYRYFRKRALYLAYIAGHLKKSELQADVKYCIVDDPFLPVIEVTPSGKLEKTVKFVIRPYVDESYFKLSKFTPTGNNIRASWLSVGEKTDHLPTPKYNSSMLRDLLLERNEALRSEMFRQVPAARDSLLLLKVWLHQRKLDQDVGAFSPFIMSMYLVYLIQQKRINVFMSSYQIVRNLLMHLAKVDLCESGITLCKTQGSKSSDIPPIEDFKSNYGAVFVDETGYLNFCAHLSLLAWNRVQWEANLSVKALDSCSGRKSFEALFMTPVSFLSTMDHVVRIQRPSLDAALTCKYSQGALHSPILALMDNGKLSARAILPVILTILRRALEGKVRLMTLEGRNSPRCEVDGSFDENFGSISLGFVLDPERAWNPLIKGPEADQPEAAEFREFWGEKSQLRRFQDGSTCEAVVFPAKTLDDKRLITKQIISYILQRHLAIKSEVYIADQLESILRQPRLNSYGTGEEANAAIVKALDGLARQLRGLDGLPLAVTSVQGISAAFRYTDVYPTIPGLPQGDERCLKKGGACMLPSINKQMVPTWIEPLKVIVTLETSNKWPDDLSALQRLKAAFHLAIARELSSKFDLLTLPAADNVAVLKDGFVFRLSVAYPREIVLAKSFKDTDGILRQKETEESRRLEMETNLLPKTTAALHGLQSQHPSFSGAARLAKRWIAAQMLTGHLPELVIELLVASTYLDSPCFDSSGPMSPQVGFLRFLQKVSRTDWKLFPLVLNFNDLLGAEQIADFETDFSKQRANLPALVVLTPDTKNPSAFTREGPILPVLARVMVLASETLRILESNLDAFKIEPDAFKVVFRPSLTIYDVIVHLKPKMVARRYMNLDAKTTAKEVETLPVDQIKMIPVVGFEPVDCYLAELKEGYGDVARFFYDHYGGLKIGIVWNKKAMEDVDFKISNVNARTMTSTGKLSLNIDAVIQDFLLIGKGLVDRVQLNSERWIVPAS